MVFHRGRSLCGEYQGTQETPVYTSENGPQGSEPCSDPRSNLLEKWHPQIERSPKIRSLTGLLRKYGMTFTISLSATS